MAEVRLGKTSPRLRLYLGTPRIQFKSSLSLVTPAVHSGRRRGSRTAWVQPQAQPQPRSPVRMSPCARAAAFVLLAVATAAALESFALPGYPESRVTFATPTAPLGPGSEQADTNAGRPSRPAQRAGAPCARDQRRRVPRRFWRAARLVHLQRVRLPIRNDWPRTRPRSWPWPLQWPWPALLTSSAAAHASIYDGA